MPFTSLLYEQPSIHENPLTRTSRGITANAFSSSILPVFLARSPHGCSPHPLRMAHFSQISSATASEKESYKPGTSSSEYFIELTSDPVPLQNPAEAATLHEILYKKFILLDKIVGTECLCDPILPNRYQKKKKVEGSKWHSKRRKLRAEKEREQSGSSRRDVLT